MARALPCLLRTLITWVLLVQIALARQPSDPSPVSCSLDGLADYSRTMPLCDLMKQARPFGSARAPYDGNCTVGSDGWPTQASFGAVFVTLPNGAPPAGVLIDGIYSLSFVGNATLSFPVSTVLLLNKTFDGVTSVAFLSVPSTNSGNVWVAWSGAAMPDGAPGVKNITLLQPGCSATGAFSPALVSLVSRFDSLRFMDWVHTNGNLEERWSERRVPSAPSFVAEADNTTGIPWEVCVALANTVQRDVWINIPAHSSDDYIAQLAALLHASLDPSLAIYYEYSNEVWNYQFEQAH